MSSDDKPVCWGRRHSFKVERLQAGTLSVAEYLDDDAVAFARCVSPTPAEWNEWFAHAWQAGQDYEVRQRDEYDAAAEDDPVCPTCVGECVCSDTVKEARARFAPDGDGAVRRKAAGTTTTVYPAYPRTAAPAGTSTAAAASGTDGVTAPFPGLAAGGSGDGADAGADAAEAGEAADSST